jgi:hypothetical protein
VSFFRSKVQGVAVEQLGRVVILEVGAGRQVQRVVTFIGGGSVVRQGTKDAADNKACVPILIDMIPRFLGGSLDDSALLGRYCVISFL